MKKHPDSVRCQKKAFSLIEMLIAICILAVALSLLASLWPAAARDAIATYDQTVGIMVAKSGIQLTRMSYLSFMTVPSGSVATESPGRSITDNKHTATTDPGNPGNWDTAGEWNYTTNQIKAGPNYNYVNWRAVDLRYSISYEPVGGTKLWSAGTYTTFAAATTRYRMIPPSESVTVTADYYRTHLIPHWQQEYPQQPKPSVINPYLSYAPRSPMGFCSLAVFGGAGTGSDLTPARILSVSYKKTGLNKRVAMRKFGTPIIAPAGGHRAVEYFYYNQGTPTPNSMGVVSHNPDGTAHLNAAGVLTWRTNSEVEWSGSEDPAHPGKGYGYFRKGGYLINFTVGTSTNTACQQALKFAKIKTVRNNGKVCTLEEPVDVPVDWRVVTVLHEEGSLPTEPAIDLSAIVW